MRIAFVPVLAPSVSHHPFQAFQRSVLSVTASGSGRRSRLGGRRASRGVRRRRRPSLGAHAHLARSVWPAPKPPPTHAGRGETVFSLHIASRRPVREVCSTSRAAPSRARPGNAQALLQSQTDWYVSQNVGSNPRRAAHASGSNRTTISQTATIAASFRSVMPPPCPPTASIHADDWPYSKV